MKKSDMKTFAAVIALLPFLASPVMAPAFAQDTAAAQKLWEGPQLFCKNCHGKAGEGAMGPDLAGRGLSASQFRQEVRKPWGVMPAFTTEQISDAEIDGLTAWFASMPKVSEPGPWRTPLTADMPRGQQAYLLAYSVEGTHLIQWFGIERDQRIVRTSDTTSDGRISLRGEVPDYASFPPDDTLHAVTVELHGYDYPFYEYYQTSRSQDIDANNVFGFGGTGSIKWNVTGDGFGLFIATWTADTTVRVG